MSILVAVWIGFLVGFIIGALSNAHAYQRGLEDGRAEFRRIRGPE